MLKKEAQEKLNEWCDDWEVPRIRVEIKSYLDGEALGFFDDVKFLIVLKEDQGKDVLQHEFRHYLLLLIRRGCDIEERICDE